MLPEAIDIYFPLKQATFRARVCWRKGDEIGVAFEPAETMAPTDPTQAHLFRRLVRVEAENAELRLEAAQLRRQLEQVAIGDAVVSTSNGSHERELVNAHSTIAAG